MAERAQRQVKKNQDLQRILNQQRERTQMRQIRKILKKPYSDRTEEELKILDSVPDLVHQIQNSIQKHKCLKERTKEIQDDPETLASKCAQLSQALKESSFTVVYTGAGISTSAQIPDYRGPDGIWTLLQQGKEIKFKDLSLAEPTFTHMALKQLHKEGFISHIVSQNCDGLHLRSGLPRSALSEVHGNMFIEVCPKCKPLKQYIRLFDVTERTGLHRHKTGRFCKKCGTELHDTIVHFGEKGTLSWPMNWKGAVKAVSKADLILCLGTSLRVLRRYHGLWMTHKPHIKRPKLYIVNLQWTSKDTQATLKIHGKCDEVMKQVTTYLGVNVPKYEKESDPIFNLASPLTSRETSTTTRLHLTKSSNGLVNHYDALDKKISHDIPESQVKIETIAEQSKKDVKSDTEVRNSEMHMDTNEVNAFLPHIKLLDITSASSLLKLNAERIDSRTYFIKSENRKDLQGNTTTFSGWYGKGCAKWKKYRRKTNTPYKV
ncbi:NAD-dependent protein deacetylase sirtuin-7-like [Stegodyphus dumicola]|uniref:NAD-dependent protein deacetylase sirtuin-7-like n=1 Tax=Stegodyphus dumicola TaxID=202533 RepID=UPI0015A8E6AA|nr:NAD-dependent protein deacetylase sirtuin-7-like [Stegodyphus dumicola]